MESGETNGDGPSATDDAPTDQGQQPTEQEQEIMNASETQGNSVPETAETAETADEGQENGQPEAVSAETEGQANKDQGKGQTEVAAADIQTTEEQKPEMQQQDQTPTENEMKDQGEIGKVEDSKENEITEQKQGAVEATVDHDQQNATENRSQSIENDSVKENASQEDHRVEHKSSETVTTETEKEEIKKVAKEKTSSNEGERDSVGQESSTEKKEEKPKKEVKSRKGVHSRAEERPPKTLERPNTQPSTTSLRSESRQRRKEKKSKRRARHSTGEVMPPKLKKKSRGSRQSTATVGESMKHLEVFILSLYQPHDQQRSGYVDQSLFWQVLESSLQLSAEELAGLQALVVPKKAGLISYEEFASQSTDIISSLYQDQPASDGHWVELKAYDGSMVVSYNKQTGEIKDMVESGADLFEGVISEMFQLADQGQKGYVSKEEFTNMLQSSEMLSYLKQEDILQMQQYFGSIPGGHAAYADFYPLAKEIILRVYRVKDPSESEWCQLNSPQVGLFWFNKYTGEARRIPADDREQEIDFLTKTYNQMEGLQAELEQCKQRNRDLENTLAQANEEQEALAAQLYETGHALDEANNEVQHKENELYQMRSVVSSKDQEINRLIEQVAELEKMEEKLTISEQELHNARKTIEVRDHSISERDTNISDLRKQADIVTENLKTATGVIDARESSITTLQQDLHSKQTQIKEFEKQVPELENKVASTEDELKSTKQTLEEKKTALGQARKHLKNAREKNMELENELEKLNLTQEKLHNAESEIRTLKSFLTTKTAIVEKRKRELRDTKVKMSELEEKDARRAVILADVLEKTARQYQQQIGTQPKSGKVSPGKGHVTQAVLQPPELRPASAPAIPPEGELIEHEPSHQTSRKVMLKSYTLEGPMDDIIMAGGVDQRGTSIAKSSKPKARSRTVPKLPPIRQSRPMQRTKSFVVPTAHDIQRHYKSQDIAVVEHASSNPQCNCELCRMNMSVMGPSSLRPETGMTTKTGGAGYQGETDVRELALSRQLCIGQRVLVHMKKTEFDLEPQQLTGIIKFVGKIDSEYIDNRIYVGVKLDEAVGNTDGLIKGKRYFICPPKHGKVVRITSVVAILPNKSVCYRPLQKITKRSPYTTVQKKVKISNT